jgi:hypothetical protein
MNAKFLVGSLVVLFSTSCASVSTLKAADPISPGDCSVTVHSSLDAAKSKGEIEELCIVSGTSSGSFSHTVATAIEKHKNKACGCGAKDVYIQAQDAGTLGTASVTLVGFRYTGASAKQRAAQPQQVDKSEQIKKAKKCQEKGGVWLDGKCEIDIE